MAWKRLSSPTPPSTRPYFCHQKGSLLHLIVRSWRETDAGTSAYNSDCRRALEPGIEGTLVLLARQNFFGETLPGALRDLGVQAYLLIAPRHIPAKTSLKSKNGTDYN